MATSPTVNLKQYVRDIPDFPKAGILFRDITPLLSSPIAFSAAIDQLVTRYQSSKIDAIVAAEARGFIFAAPLAIRLGAAFVPVRKPGKLPYDVHSFSYELEYGKDTLQIHTDALRPGSNVLVVDDLLATGGTVEACCRLIEKSNANIAGLAFCIHLKDLGGEARLRPHDVYSLIEY